MTFTTDTQADILAITLSTLGVYDGGEILDDADVVLEFDTNNTVMRIEILHYQQKMPALMTFITALVGMEANNAKNFTREDIVRFLNFSQLVPVTQWFTPQKTTAAISS
ncbi:MAG: DUF2283 domain-containing protein [Candidatus Kapabacteria bacterium]|nr:DUF2283 domain-containing protein [Candidatus Kapabacteria bacterium]